MIRYMSALGCWRRQWSDVCFRMTFIWSRPTLEWNNWAVLLRIVLRVCDNQGCLARRIHSTSPGAVSELGTSRVGIRFCTTLGAQETIRCIGAIEDADLQWQYGHERELSAGGAGVRMRMG